MQRFIESGADLEARDVDGFTVLHRSLDGRSEFVDWESVALLIHAGADVNARTTHAEITPLMLAVSARRLCAEQAILLANMLVDAGADVNAAAHDGQTAVHRVLLRRVRGGGSLPRLRWLLQHGAACEVRDKRGRAPLHLAAGVMFESLLSSHDGRGAVDLLLQQQPADVDAQDENGSTPMHHAMRGIGGYGSDVNDCGEIAIALVKHGASLRVRDNEGRTPIDYCHEVAQRVRAGPANLLMTIMAHQSLMPLLPAVANYFSEVGLSPIDGTPALLYCLVPRYYIAVNRAFVDGIRAIIEIPSVDVNETNSEGRTALHYAISRACSIYFNNDPDRQPALYTEVVRALVDAGAVAHLRSADGKLPSECCRHHTDNGWPEEHEIGAMLAELRRRQGAGTKAARR